MPTVTARSCWSTTATRPGTSARKVADAGATGAGDRVDIVTGTFGKTLGGGMGGFVAADQPMSTLAPAGPALSILQLARASPRRRSLKALEIANGADGRRALLKNHARRFREGVEKAGKTVAPGETPIIPVMLGEAQKAQDLAHALDERGVIRRRIFLSRRTEGPGAHPHANVGGADRGRHRFCDRGLRRCGKALGMV